MVRATKAILRFIGTCPTLRCTHSAYIQTRRGPLGVSNEVWFRRFSSPPFGSLFILFPFTHLCFPLFFHVLLSSFFVISSFLSFARTSVLALVCTCTSTFTFNPGLGRPGLDNEVGFIDCPCALGFSFIATTHTFAPSSPPSRLHPFCLCCAHTCALVLALIHFASPQGGVCVCVTFGVTRFLLDCFFCFFFFFFSRGTGADLPIQSNEVMAFRWMSGLINHLYLHVLTWNFPLVPACSDLEFPIWSRCN